MGYLHAKGITLKTLSSKSIYLECKVKISIADQDFLFVPNTNDISSQNDATVHLPERVGSIAKGHLTYWSPELMQSVKICGQHLVVDHQLASNASDVYAFG